MNEGDSMVTTVEQLKQAQAQNRELLKEIKALTATVQTLTEEVAFFQRQLFGKHSEKITDPNQLSLLADDNGVFTDPEQTGNQSETTVTTVVHKPKRKRCESVDPNLPIETTVIRRENLSCDHGHQLIPVGKHFVREVVHQIPGRLYREQIFEQTYKCAACETNDGVSHLYQGTAPQALIPHSLATSSLVAELLYQKYALGTPLYRQMKAWRRAGLILSETTMTNWVIKAATIVQPLYTLLHEQLLTQPYLQGDETPFQVLREVGKTAQSKSYIWIARSIRLAAHQVVYYTYSDNRAGKTAQQLYGDFTGVLQCDGYSGYNLLGATVTRVGCWAHVRRKFFDDACKIKGQPTITPPLKLLDQMFHLERGWRDLTPTKRKELRQEQLKPVIKQFWQWCDQAVATPKSRLGRALTYAQNQRSALDRVLDYGEIDLSNNATERNVKSFVIGRKNWLFATSPAGAQANAIWLTLIETAKANGLDPRQYLEYLLNQLGQLPVFPTEEELAVYLPWQQVPDKKVWRDQEA